jgi:hypothetical protein
MSRSKSSYADREEAEQIKRFKKDREQSQKIVEKTLWGNQADKSGRKKNKK